MERNKEIDILKGIGISLMVFNHISWGLKVHTYIQSFHMPLFFIVSGYLYKQKPLKDVAYKRTKSLLFPYLLFMSLYFIIALTTSLPVEKITFYSALKAIFIFPTDNTNMPISPALWFLPCMFLSSLVYTALGNISFGKKSIIVLSLAVISTVYSALSDYMLPFCIEPTAVALFFMLIGEWMRKEKTYEPMISKPIFVVGLIIIEAVFAYINKAVDMRSARFHIVPLYFFNGVLGTVAYWGISRWIDSAHMHFWGVLRKVLGTIGRYSIVFLCTHQLFILILKKGFADIIVKGILYKAGIKSLIWIVAMILGWILVVGCRKSKYMKILFGLS